MASAHRQWRRGGSRVSSHILNKNQLKSWRPPWQIVLNYSAPLAGVTPRALGKSSSLKSLGPTYQLFGKILGALGLVNRRGPWGAASGHSHRDGSFAIAARVKKLALGNNGGAQAL